MYFIKINSIDSTRNRFSTQLGARAVLASFSVKVNVRGQRLKACQISLHPFFFLHCFNFWNSYLFLIIRIILYLASCSFFPQFICHPVLVSVCLSISMFVVYLSRSLSQLHYLFFTCLL